MAYSIKTPILGLFYKKKSVGFHENGNFLLGAVHILRQPPDGEGG